MLQCKNFPRYQGIYRPRCNGGAGCDACTLKYYTRMRERKAHKRKPKPHMYWVIGYYEDPPQRYADTFRATTAAGAEMMAVANNPELIVAGVLRVFNHRIKIEG